MIHSFRLSCRILFCSVEFSRNEKDVTDLLLIHWRFHVMHITLACHLKGREQVVDVKIINDGRVVLDE